MAVTHKNSLIIIKINMAQLFALLHGRKKDNLKPIMIDTKNKCQNYMEGRIKSGVLGFHKIELAPNDAKTWKKNTTNQWTNYNESGPCRS